MRLILAILSLFPNIAFAGLPPTTLGGQLLTGSAPVTFNFKVPLNQATRINSTTALIETGNDNRLKNPQFHSVNASDGWVIGSGVTAITDDTYYYTPPKSLQLTLPSGTQSNLDVISQTYTASFGDLDGSNLQAYIRLSAAVFQAGVDLKWCLDINSVQVQCDTILPNDIMQWAIVSLNYPAKATSPDTVYRVYLRANYTGIVGAAAIINAASSYFGPATNLAFVSPPNTFTAMVSSASGASSLTGSSDWVSCTSASPSVCTFKTSLFTSNPNCGTSTTSTTSTNTSTAGAASASGVTVYFNGATTVKLTCDKTGADYNLPAIVPGKVQGNFSGSLSGSGQWTTTSASFSDFGSGSGTSLTKINGSNLVCSAISGNLPGITCTSQYPGLYQVCVNATAWGSSAGSTNALRLVDGSGNVINSGAAFQDATAGYAQTYDLCGIVTADSTFSIKIQGQTTAGTMTLNASTATYRPTFTVIPATANIPVPIFVGNVTTPSTLTSDLIFRANGVTCGASSSITGGTGGVSIGNYSTGSCAITFSPAFSSSNYSCDFVALGSSTSTIDSYKVTSKTASGFTLVGITQNGATTSAASTGFQFDMKCQGPR
ncbi:hypothetical protein [Bdellovibrio sp. ArHS]|uniref:hypothetical protein n=1 Tax=Bdellovibrio sp. ArHS TaxID=1569284 RepID=UPI000AFB0AFE|nr:hypothetical protein [Bdellovibrio sp. ArHS]